MHDTGLTRQEREAAGPHPIDTLGGPSVADMTFAAEQMGSDPNAKSDLLWLLAHPSSIVREGALLGIAQQEGAWVIPTLQRVSDFDASETIRTIAKELLEGRCQSP